MIYVNTTSVNQTASAMASGLDRHEDVMKSIRTLIFGLDTIYKGKGADAFIETFRSLQPDINNFHSMLDDFIDVLKKASAIADNVDDDLLRLVNRID